MSDARNLGETAFVRERGQPSAEIVRVGCAKPGETAFVRERGQPSAEIVRVDWNALIFVFANVSYETLILEGLFVSFCECLARNAYFGRSLCQFLRMSRTKRSFWKVSLSVFANVSYETFILEALFVSFCECLVRNAHFGRSLCQFLRMSRTKRSFWKVSLSVFANVLYETHFGRSLCQFLRMSRTKRSFWKLSLSVFANVSYDFANVAYERQKESRHFFLGGSGRSNISCSIPSAKPSEYLTLSS